MKNILLLIVLLIAGTVLFASGQKNGVKESLSGNYAFGGSTTVDPIFRAAIEDWKKIHPDAHISYEGVGSGNGIKGVISGTYSLGASSREVAQGETDNGVKSIAVALDALAFIVNKDTLTVSNLTIEQAAKIYMGQIRNWKDVGGPDHEIVVYNRDEASGTYETVKTFVVTKVGGKDAKFYDKAGVVTSAGDMAAKVGGTPYAIGYVGLASTEAAGVSPVNLNNIKPDIANVYNKTYPVWRNLNVVYKGDLGKTEKAFVDYLLSKEGQEIAADVGFIKLPTK